MRGIWVVTVLLSGCSLFDSLDVVYESGTDSGDVGTTSDVNLDAQIGADVSTDDMTTDMQADLSSDMSTDTSPDMVADASEDSGDMATCLSELPRTVIPTGIACQTIPPETGVASCDVVAQTGCPTGEYCDLLPFSQTAFKTVCREGLSVTENTCDFVDYDDPCTSRATVNDPPEPQGACYPGSVCRGVKAMDLTSPCSRFCVLESAKGCNPAEYCVPIATQYSVFGVGRCATDPTDCP